MKILLTIFFLLFSSSVVAELPISLFGIEILEKGEIYKKDTSITRTCNSYRILNDKTRPSWTNIKFKKNDLFDRQCIKMYDDGIIHTINGIKMWLYFDDFEKSDLNDYGLEESLEIVKTLRKNLSTLYKINEKKFKVFYTYQISEDTHILNNYFYIKYKKKSKGNLYSYGFFQAIKEQNPSPNIGKIGSGWISIDLSSNKEKFDIYMQGLKDKKNNIIKENELDSYIELFNSSHSVF